MIDVLVSGALGRMGTNICKAVHEEEGLNLVAGVDPQAQDGMKILSSVPVFDTLEAAFDNVEPDVMIDFTRPDVAEANIRAALSRSVRCVLGTTGLSEESLQQIYDESAVGDVCLFHAPNFTTGAVLMMVFSKMAAKYFPDIEVLELHHDGKKDAPSGTAIRTARLIAQAKEIATGAPGKETELDGFEGARGASVDGIPVHSIRTSGHVAHQEVIFGSDGQTLTIRHDSIDRASYMPGIMLATKEVMGMHGVCVGLEKLMGLDRV